MTFFRKALLSGLALLASAGPALASENPAMDADVMRINNGWAHIRYQVRDRSAQFSQLAALEGQAHQVSAKYPGRAEPLLWEGIVVSEEAARASALRQLGLATRARDILAKAYAINPRVADGGAAMSLGVLYYKVPGWPIGFGSTAKARSFFQQALAQDPKGLDNNFFYGDFLAQEGDKARARQYLQRALQAPTNPNRPVWDAGRRAEVRSLLAKLG
nr:tetratricopeptide repeat protein [uncultured Sphingomonas sp.]